MSHLRHFGKCGVLHENDLIAKACKSNVLDVHVWTCTEVFAKWSLQVIQSYYLNNESCVFPSDIASYFFLAYVVDLRFW